MITALVPARRETRGLANKNILPFANSSLLEHKIDQLKRVSGIHRIILSTDDEEITRRGEAKGVEVVKRPPEAEGSFSDLVRHTTTLTEDQDILWACVTAPFIDSQDYERAIFLYREKRQESYDSLITVTALRRHILDINGPVNFQRGLKHKDSDQLGDLFLYSNGITIAPRREMAKWGYHWGKIPYRMEVDRKKGLDIMDETDYEEACAWYAYDQRENKTFGLHP